ncbi:YopX family protein [Prevotella intermedia]|nr:YopX family protein [Prevotella intermedia]
MTQIATTIEQGKKLKELGINVDTADMHYWFDANYNEFFLEPSKASDNMEKFPAWSLGALIKLLPDTIILDNGDVCDLSVLNIGVYYRCFVDRSIVQGFENENILMQEFNDDPNCFDVFTLDEIKGDLRLSYTSPVIWEEGTFCISTNGDWLHHNDMFLAVLFGDMKRSSPIFDFEVIGNIHDNPELIK